MSMHILTHVYPTFTLLYPCLHMSAHMSVPVSMHVVMHTYTHTDVPYVNTHGHTCICNTDICHIQTHVCAHVYVHSCIHNCAPVLTHVCMHVYLHVYAYGYARLCTCPHTRLYTYLQACLVYMSMAHFKTRVCTHVYIFHKPLPMVQFSIEPEPSL